MVCAERVSLVADSKMKLAFCATNPPSAKILCSAAASRFQSSPTVQKSGPGGPGAPTPTNVAMTWYCEKSPDTSDQHHSQICKHEELLKKLRETQDPATKKTTLAEMKQYPAAPYGTLQAIYTDFCKLKTSAQKPICVSTRRTNEQKAMAKWYCGQDGNTESLFCKRTSLLNELSKLPPSPAGSVSDERKAVSTKLSGLLKTTAGAPSSENPSAKIGKEIAAATKQYCESHAEATICKPRPQHGPAAADS